MLVDGKQFVYSISPVIAIIVGHVIYANSMQRTTDNTSDAHRKKVFKGLAYAAFALELAGIVGLALSIGFLHKRPFEVTVTTTSTVILLAAVVLSQVRRFFTPDSEAAPAWTKSKALLWSCLAGVGVGTLGLSLSASLSLRNMFSLRFPQALVISAILTTTAWVVYLEEDVMFTDIGGNFGMTLGWLWLAYMNSLS